MSLRLSSSLSFLDASHSLHSFANYTPPPQIYPLSLHDALPICPRTPPGPARRSRGRRTAPPRGSRAAPPAPPAPRRPPPRRRPDRKSTRLNSSHLVISYAVFCLKKKTRPSAEPRHTPKAPPPST